MGIKTSDFVPNLPPKDFESLTPEEISIGIDWLGILDSFDPTKLDQRFLNECARRNPYDTCYRWDKPTGNTHTGNMPPIPPTPIASRLKSLEREQERSSENSPLKSIYRRQLEECVKRIETEGLKRGNYNTARTLLIQLIGMKGALEYVRREYERLGEAGRKKQYEEYIAWERKREAEEQRREAELEAEELEWEEELEKAEETGDYSYFKDRGYLCEPQPASVHEKIVTIRKGILASNSKPLKQRDLSILGNSWRKMYNE